MQAFRWLICCRKSAVHASFYALDICGRTIAEVGIFRFRLSLTIHRAKRTRILFQLRPGDIILLPAALPEYGIL
jgi:hypothetical protein